MENLTWLDWAIYLGGMVGMPLVLFGYQRWKSYQAYREISESIARIGVTFCRSCGHAEHQMGCLKCGCDWMANPDGWDDMDTTSAGPAGERGGA